MKIKNSSTPKLPNDPTEAVSLILTLCQMEGFLLSRHVESLKLKHQREGGFTEKLYRRKKEFRGFVLAFFFLASLFFSQKVSAATEFAATVMQSGGDYNTLASWENAIDCNLTAATTLVFSHGAKSEV